MKCHRCKQGQLKLTQLEGQFKAHTCDHCAGHWILVEDFMQWKQNNRDYQFSCEQAPQSTATDTALAVLCPVTGAIMRKYKIDAETNHRIDYSQAVSGYWLDAGEWHYLKQQGLAMDLNKIASDKWQRQIREQQAMSHFKAVYQQKFGEQSYQQLQEIRAWLAEQPYATEMKNYLIADDPYSMDN